MSTTKQYIKKHREIIPSVTPGNLFLFEEFDHFFEYSLSCRCPRLLELYLPIGLDRRFPKIDNLGHEKEIKRQVTVPDSKSK
jgi:hypothetical protein